MNEIIFVEKRKDALIKFVICLSILFFLTALIIFLLNNVPPLEFSFTVGNETITQIYPKWHNWLYYLMIIIPVFLLPYAIMETISYCLKTLNPDKIIIGKNNIYISYLKQYIPYDYITVVKSVEYNGRLRYRYYNVKYNAIYVKNRNELIKYLSFFEKLFIKMKYFLKDDNSILTDLSCLSPETNKKMYNLLNDNYQEYRISIHSA